MGWGQTCTKQQAAMATPTAYAFSASLDSAEGHGAECLFFFACRVMLSRLQRHWMQHDRLYGIWQHLEPCCWLQVLPCHCAVRDTCAAIYLGWQGDGTALGSSAHFTANQPC